MSISLLLAVNKSLLFLHAITLALIALVTHEAAAMVKLEMAELRKPGFESVRRSRTG